MTKKIVLCLLLAVVAAALVCTAAACSGGDTYTITFMDGDTVLENKQIKYEHLFVFPHLSYHLVVEKSRENTRGFLNIKNNFLSEKIFSILA